MFWNKQRTVFTIEYLANIRAILFIVIAIPILSQGQTDSLVKSLKLEGDFRFRIEQDWNVRRPDGSYQEDRSRLRYRARFGLQYQHNSWSSMGFRLRTGDPDKQQDPQLTLGEEFSGLPISFEKAYAAFHHHWFEGWLGKNTFPFEKQNELFWSDNVFPEGIALSGDFQFHHSIVDDIRLSAGHFIFVTDGSTFGADSYIQGVQLSTSWWQQRLILFPSFYYFKEMPDIPDGNETFLLDYRIVHLGLRYYLIKKPEWTLEIDYYQNLEDLEDNDGIADELNNESTGITLSTHYGGLNSKGDWYFRLTYNYQEKYAAVDYLAQNDWARWDYSDQGSPDGRLTNYNGWEIMAAYALTKDMNLKMRFFTVEQLISPGSSTETNSRIRLDYNIRF